MAVEGRKGIVELSREWPAPTALDDARLQRGASPSLDLTDQAFQSGDEVLLLSLRGVPLGVGVNGAAPCPVGHAFWPGGDTAVGPALAARSAGGGFWSADLAQPFWESAATVGLQQFTSAFIHRDELDDVRFYSSEIDAINGGNEGLIPLRNISPGTMLILPATAAGNALYITTLSGGRITTLAESPLVTLGSGGEYATAALQLLQAITGMPIPDGEQPAANLAEVPDVLTAAASDAEQRGWLVQCDLTGWVFEMDATQLDETAIGQAFGETAKGVLRGAGSFNGEVDHSRIAGEQSGLGLLKLMMLTAQGSKARARFQLMDQRTSTVAEHVKERVFYETDILMGRTSVNTQATDVIRLTGEFIATGRIRLVRGGSTPAPISPALLFGAATGRGSLVGTASVLALLSGVATGRGSLVGTARVAGLLSGAVTGRGSLSGSLSSSDGDDDFLAYIDWHQDLYTDWR